ncbi:MAG: universal stress protein [Thermoplasmata archaeon]
MYGKVILPTDGSKLSFVGIKAGLKAARTLNIPAVAVYVIKPEIHSQARMAGIGYDTKKFLTDSFRKQGLEALKRIKKKADEMGVDLDMKLAEGEPYEEINKLAGENDIIYISSHGRTGFSYIFMGSTTDRVLKHTKATVAVVKAKE